MAPLTIYAHFGSKAGVLTGLVDLMDDEAGIPDLMTESAGLTDPVALLGLLAAVSRQVRERCGDIVTMLSAGAAVDPAIAATQAEVERRNRFGVEMAIGRAMAHGGRVVPRATDIAVALLSVGVCFSLVRDSGWSYDDYEIWLTDTLVDTLLR